MNTDQPHSSDKNNSDSGALQEYRLVPVEEWTKAGKKKETYSVDVKALTGTVWSNRNFVLKVTVVFVIIGIIIALLTPTGYKVEATLVPESQGIPAAGLLQQFGGFLGISGAQLGAKNNNLPPQLYPKVVNSLPYQVELLNKEITFAEPDTTVTAYTFFNKLYTPSIFTYIRAYTLGLPNKIKSLFTGDKQIEALPATVLQDSIITLTKHQLDMVEMMRGHVSISINESNGLIKLQVTMPDPQAAAELGEYSIDLLEQYVTNYRTRKAERYLQFVTEQTQKAREKLQEVQTRLAKFQDQNINLATAQAMTHLKRLESKYELFFNKYQGLAKQLQQAKLKVQQKTPILTVLNPIKLPVENYTPQVKLIIAIFLVAGLVLSIIYIMGRSIIAERKKSA